MKKQQMKWLIGTLMVVLVTVLSVGVGAKWVAADEGRSDQVLGLMGECLKSEPNLITRTVCENLGEYLLAEKGVKVELGYSDQKLGSSSLSTAGENTGFTQYCEIDNTETRVLCNGLGYGAMPAAGSTVTTTQYWANALGQAIYIKNHDTFYQFSGTASSSVVVSMGTSTVSGIVAYTTTPPANIIAATTIATSTVGASAQGLVQVATTLVGLSYLANNEYIIMSWKQENNDCSGAYCEAVTSSARGYEATYYIPFFYTKAY